MSDFDLIVVGGGAAGFFGAIQAAEQKPGIRILLLEKSSKLLSKVKISGGGRCNVTHHCFEPVKLAHHYPRGEKTLKTSFRKFQPQDVIVWFASKNVALKVEDDGRMFPVSNDSQTIIDCFLQEAHKHQVKIQLETGVTSLTQQEDIFHVSCSDGKKYQSPRMLIAIGGNPNIQFYQWIAALGHQVISPIPSLFTFNDTSKEFTELMGIAVPHAEVRIASSKFADEGPLLITHWGLSGPAVIKLSAWAAQHLHDIHYKFTALVSWIGPAKEEEIRATLTTYKAAHGKQKIFVNPLFSLPQRLWTKLCQLAEIEDAKIWAELPQRNLNKLIEFLIRCPFLIKGKTTFKEEFVTCGGVDLKEIDTETMESKKVKGLYFAGEVLNIDGETGGFNFQAAWTTAFIAAQNIAKTSQA